MERGNFNIMKIKKRIDHFNIFNSFLLYSLSCRIVKAIFTTTVNAEVTEVAEIAFDCRGRRVKAYRTQSQNFIHILYKK